ncbi:MAG: helix-turn-helix transcriptional regulator [Burkholderiaceae bacterium]
MPPPRSAHQALARLHQVAGLDLQGPQLIAPVLQALRPLVPFDAGGYVHAGSDGVLQTHLEDPGIRARVADYFDPRILHSERQVFHCSLRDLGHTVHLGSGPLLLEQLLKVPQQQMRRSEFFNVVLRPSGVTDWATLVLRADGQWVGTLILYRHAGAPAFTHQELEVLAPLQARLGRLLQPGDLDLHEAEVVATGLLIATGEGRLQWVSPDAETLMRQAFGWRWRGAADVVPAPLQDLLRRLHVPALPGQALPQLELSNAQGWFSLRATRMTAASGTPGAPGAPQAVALHITRRVARGARLLSALQALGLPRRQAELAWWLARGLPESRIAERMGISANTVVYHRRQLYNRLGLQGRQELLERLQGAGTSRT